MKQGQGRSLENDRLNPRPVKRSQKLPHLMKQDLVIAPRPAIRRLEIYEQRIFDAFTTEIAIQ